MHLPVDVSTFIDTKARGSFFGLHSSSGSEFPTCRRNSQGGFHAFLSGEAQVKECRLSESRIQPSVSTFQLCRFDFHLRIYLLISANVDFPCVCVCVRMNTFSKQLSSWAI